MRALFVSAYLILSLMISPLGAAAELLTEVIPTQRNAQELQPALSPIVAPEGSVSVFRNQLIVRGTAAKLKTVREVLQKLDAPLQNLLIQVRRNTGSAISTDKSAYQSGQVQIITNRSHLQDKYITSLRLLDGEAARIATGEERITLSSVSTGQSPGVGFSTQKTERGFYVLPRLLADNRVQLSITVNNQRPQSGGMKFDQADSVLVMPLGVWQPLGATSSNRTEDDRGITWSTSRKSEGSNDLEIRVDLAN